MNLLLFLYFYSRNFILKFFSCLYSWFYEYIYLLWKKTQCIRVSREVGNTLVIKTIKMFILSSKSKTIRIPGYNSDTEEIMKIEILERN